MDFLAAFVFGSLIGSFLGLVSDRLPENKSIIRGRSICDKCGRKLNWYELIPLFSFLFLRGRCLKCKKQIGFRLLAIEILSGFLTAYTLFYSYKNNLPFFDVVVLLLIVYTFVAIFFTDLKYSIIPDKLLLFLTIFTIIRLYLLQNNVLNSILAALGAFFFFLLLFLITKGKGMGFGDVKLSFVLGLLLSFPLIIISLYISFLTGAALSIILVVLRRRSFRGGVIPFGPFLVFGGLLSLFFEQWLINILNYFF